MSNELNTLSERDQRLQQVLVAYLEAVEQGRSPDPGELAARHPEFAAELNEFLANHAHMDRLAAPLRGVAEAARAEAEARRTLGAQAAAAAAPNIVRYFGDYQLVQEIARGGMGVIYKARQVSLNRIVALKMILAGQLAAPADVQRFRTEAEAAANLDHPNIVPIYEVGEHDGQQYFSMKLIEGGNLSQQVKEFVQQPRKAAELMTTVARAVHHAHQRRILHRDLKPGNILLDLQGEPHVTDFGLAKRVEGDSVLTQTGAVVGTPSYMAPEQALAKKDLSTAADIYSLGAILYELLTGLPPFRGTAPLEILMHVMEREPQKPRDLNAAVDHELETICLKCLEKEPAKRYSSAEALAEDLERWLNGEPIRALPASSWERTVKWTKRRPALATLVAVCVLGLIGTLLNIWHFTTQLERRFQESQEAQRAEADARQKADEARAQADKARADEAEQRDKADHEAYVAKVALAAARIDQGVFGNVAELLDSCPPHLRGWEWGWLKGLCHRYVFRFAHDSTVNCVAVSPDGSRLATGSDGGVTKVWDARTGKVIATLAGQPSAVKKVLFSEDGKTIITSGVDDSVMVLDPVARRDNAVSIWDAATGKQIRSFKGSYQVVSANGKRVLTVDKDQKVHIWDTDTGNETTLQNTGLQPMAGDVRVGPFSPDGKRVLLGLNRLNADTKRFGFSGAIWDVPSGKEITLPGMPLLMWAAFSPDGKRLLTRVADPTRADGDPRTILLDAETGKETASLQAPWYWTAAFSPDSRRVITAGINDHTARIFDTETGKQITSWKGPAWVIRSIAFDASGKRLVVTGEDATARVWNAESGEELAAFRGHSADLTCAIFVPDGRRVLTGSLDRTAKLWNVQNTEALTLRAHPVSVSSAAFSPDGSQLLSARGNLFAHVWDPVTGKELAQLTQGDVMIFSAIFSSDGQRVLTSGARIVGGSIAPVAGVWEARSGKQLASVQVRQQGESFGNNCLAISPDGKRIVSGGPDPTGKLWDGLTGKEIGTLTGHAKGIHLTSFSRDGSRMLTASLDATIRIWDAGTLKELAVLPEPGRVWCATFSPDGRRILVCSAQGAKSSVKLLDAATGATIKSLPEPEELSRSFGFFSDGQLGSKRKGGFLGVLSQPVVFSADGKRFILPFAGKDGLVPVWDAASGKEVLVLKGHSHAISTAAFSHDGSRILTGSLAGKVAKLWDASTGRELLNFPQPADVTVVAFSPDSRQILIACADGAIRILTASSAEPTSAPGLSALLP